MNEELILDEMLKCNTCVDIGETARYDKGMTKRQKIDKMYELLPTIDFAKDQVVNYIFSDGLVAGTLNETDKLNEFLDRRNLEGTANFSTLREAVGWAIIDGEAGVRELDGDLYLYKSGHFGVIYDTEDGITKVEGYIVRSDGGMLSDIDKSDDSLYGITSYEDYVDNFGEDIEVLSLEEFAHLRNDISFLHGQSPLLTDQLRLDLLIEAYSQLLKDLKYDGPGRLILRPKDGFVAGEENDISTGQILDSGIVNEEVRARKARLEVERVAREIKNSSSDSVIAISSGFQDNIEHLDRVTKATEFLEWIQDKEGMIISEVIGVEGRLLGYGHQAGNVAMNKVIDNAMRNNIIPLRRAYEVQFADLVERIVGVVKIHFGEHIFDEDTEIGESRERVVDMMVKLSGIGQTDLVESFAQMLRNDLYDDRNSLKKLSVITPRKKRSGVVSKIKALIGGNEE